MRAKAVMVMVSLLILAGCAATTPAPQFSVISPADENGPEAGTPPPEPALADEPEASAPPQSARTSEPAAGHDGHAPPSPDEPVYTCPMHPEVREASPGSCPKCGMPLVKAADAKKQP